MFNHSSISWLASSLVKQSFLICSRASTIAEFCFELSSYIFLNFVFTSNLVDQVLFYFYCFHSTDISIKIIFFWKIGFPNLRRTYILYFMKKFFGQGQYDFFLINHVVMPSVIKFKEKSVQFFCLNPARKFELTLRVGYFLFHFQILNL